MDFLFLDAKTIHAAFLIACDFIVTHREHLNAINVFPVADGDTGDNMSSTALAVIHHSSAKATVNETLQSIANSALMGARGNSGMILSQFFNGLTETNITSEQIDTVLFAKIITQASQSVRASIVHPVEGTIITIIDAWAACINELVAQKITCFKDLITQSLITVEQALHDTTATLNILHENRVVDAGALGFSYFLHGFKDYLENPRILDVSQMNQLVHDMHHEEHTFSTEMPEHRYCTEIMLEGSGIERTQLAHHLKQFGDSIVSSGNKMLCRFHIHCNDTIAVFEPLLKLGKITQSKAEDMVRQHQMIYQRQASIALVTDSSADIPQEILDKYQIHIIPLNINLDGHNLLDRRCIDKKNFYDHLAELKDYPKTSFPSPALLERQIKQIADHYEHVLIIPLAQALSGTHDALINATKEMPHVSVIDSCNTTATLGLLVTYTAQLIAQGLSFSKIKDKVLAKRVKMHLFVYVNHFESLIRSGRISKISGMIAQLAHIKPIITLNHIGKGVLIDKAFTETKGLIKLINHVHTIQKNASLEEYAIVHSGVPEKAHHFAQLTTEAFGVPPVFIDYTSTVIGLHAGKGSIAIATAFK